MPDPELEPGPRWNDDETSRPFHVVVNPKQQARNPIDPDDVTDADGHLDGDDDEMPISLEEIEAAYLRALESAAFMDEIASSHSSEDELEATGSDVSPNEFDPEIDLNYGESGSEERPAESGPLVDAEKSGAETSADSGDDGWPVSSVDTAESSLPQLEPIAETTPATQPASASKEKSPRYAASKVDFRTDEIPDENYISLEQVLEAVLFVGGNPLPTKKLLDLLGGSTTSEQLDQIILTLNSKYLAEGRPYEIRMQTGGYVMQLREEFESVRSRTFGHGPKEVKLAQDALEVLALVAYKQPISKQEMEETGKQNLGPLLRQLLRRQLIILERHEGKEAEQYKTTPRFLGLFGLQSIEDLPQTGDFNFK